MAVGQEGQAPTETPLSKQLRRILRHLESEGAWPQAKSVEEVDWSELIRSHPAFRHISTGG